MAEEKAQEEEKTSEEFMAEVEKEGEEAFPEQDKKEKETPADPPTEEKPKEEDKETEKPPSSQGEESKEEVETSKENTETEDNVPFHKHPRWKQMYEENKALRQDIDDIKGDAEKDKLQQEERQQSQTIPSWFSAQYGDDSKTWNDYKTYELSRENRIKDDILKGQQEVVEKQQQEASKWTGWVDDQVTTLKDEGKKFDRNELLKLIGDIRPTDEQGNLDFHKGFELLQERESIAEAKKTIKTKAKKEVAAQTMDEGKGEAEKKDYTTSKELRNIGWTDLT